MAADVSERVRALVRYRERNRCARCGVPTPTGHIHHRRGRSVRDEHTHCACNCVLLCWKCHVDVHANPVAGKAAGWIVSRFITSPFQVNLIANRARTRVTWRHNCTGDIVGVTTLSH